MLIQHGFAARENDEEKKLCNKLVLRQFSTIHISVMSKQKFKSGIFFTKYCNKLRNDSAYIAITCKFRTVNKVIEEGWLMYQITWENYLLPFICNLRVIKETGL